MEKEEADRKVMEHVKRKLKEGWIKSTMIIEVLAIKPDAAESALKKHMDMMEKEDKTIIYRKEWYDVKEIKQVMPGLEMAYSTMVDIELLTQNYEKLVYLVMNYGPSSVEVLEPESIKLDLGQAQGILVSIADMLHKFARQGIGGVVVRT